jgi:ATP-dependent Clp protease ATP-binding subunit ClpC
VAEEILKGEIQQGDTILADWDEKATELHIQLMKKPVEH